MDAKQRPPRKYFFSGLQNQTPVELKFKTEPVWIQRPKGEALTAMVEVNGSLMELEQFTPDAYDFSQALVAALGGTVDGKKCAVTVFTKKVPSRRSPTGEASVIEKFVIKPL